MLLLLIIPLTVSLELPHGVPYTKSSFYSLGKPFACLDGSLTIPWTKVNDDYCDCTDGSDEPGTPACRLGKFYCKDTQYKIRAISTAYVKDGYCDCCDGSDEYGSGVTCDSTCKLLAAADQQARSVKRAELEEGHKLFKKFAEQLKIENAKREQERAAAEEAARVAAVENQTHTEQVADTSTPPSDQQGVPSEPNVTPSEPAPEEAEEDLHGDDESEDHAEEHEPGDDVPQPTPEPIDFGPEGVFQVLHDMQPCLEFTDNQYTYEFCGFREVFQREGPHGKVSLGKWAGWGHSDDEDPRKYDLMLFKNGLSCWNGPARSTKVFVHCGSTNKLLSVAEPSRCEYVMHLRTFAACYEDPAVLFKRLHPEDY